MHRHLRAPNPRSAIAGIRARREFARILLLAAFIAGALAALSNSAVAQVMPLPDVTPPVAEPIQLGPGVTDPVALMARNPGVQMPGVGDIHGQNSWRPPPMAAPCATDNFDAKHCNWHSQVLPQGLIYQSYMAGMKEPRIASFWNSDKDLGTIWDIALGGRAGIWRYGTENPDWPEGWEVDLEGAVFPRLDPFGESTPLISSDYRFGIPVTYGRGQWQFKTGYYHISSHLGDEFMLENPGIERVNFVRDGVVFGAGYFPWEELRLYAEMGVCAASGGAEPLEFQFGFDWAPARNTGLRGGPFCAMNTNLRQEVDFGGDFVVQFGWLWRHYARGADLRIGGQYFYGNSDQFEFFHQTESRIGWGIWYDF